MTRLHTVDYLARQMLADEKAEQERQAAVFRDVVWTVPEET